ncbi:MAG TPA: alpha/beta hydrolase [Bryobacteraceae bacterium]|nr:alpha/beta hydrolase [Bryobacteraceae bacterium]
MQRQLARGQFHVLYRNFLLQIVDTETIPTHGDPTRLLVQIGALLVSLSFIFAVEMIPQYVKATASEITAGAWGDQEFLIGTTIAVVGMFTVFAWDSVFPNRRDSLVLGALPIRPGIIFRAKIAAIATGLGMSIVALNAATGLAYPFAIGGVRTFFAYWITMGAAGLWIFSTLLAAQGVSALLFSYRRFLKTSNVLQVSAFFSVLGAYFLTPGPLDMDLSHGIPIAARRLPSFWFLGLFQRVNGSQQPWFAPLANRALLWLLISSGVAIFSYALSYYRTTRRVLEEPDIIPADRAHAGSRWLNWAAARLAAKPLDRAMLLFIQRTLVRSRAHRNLLAAFMGLGLAICLVFAKSLLYGNSRMYALARHYGYQPPHWYEMNTPMMAAGFILLFLAIFGTRTAFALPVALKANWIFRIAAVHSPRAYFAAVRKVMFTLIAAPIWIAAAVFYLSVWDGPEPAGHVLILLAVGYAMVEWSLAEFRKMPFACAYMPGESNLRIKLPVYGAAFLFAVDVGVNIEQSVFESLARSILLAALLVPVALQARRRWKTFAAAPFQQLQFDAEPASDVSPLDLSRDGIYTRSQNYLDVINAPPEPGFRERAVAFGRKTAFIAAGLCGAGFVYEQVSEMRNPLPPRQGKSIDIGGRTLNYSCIGQGAPTVLFEGGGGGAGFYWTPMQRKVAEYTRACWYDRAGYGWSDPASFPHPASAIASDLHRLVAKAGMAPPFVLVGLSFGGVCARVYAQRYPSEVSGMVLVDSSHVDEREPITPLGGGYLPYFPSLLPALSQILRPIGFLRLVMRPSELTPFEPRTFAESFKEGIGYESALEARAVRNLGDIPLIVLTAGIHRRNPPHSPVEAREEREWEEHWIEAQRQLVRLSTRGEQRIFRDAKHNLAQDRPEDVLKAIRDVVDRVRASSSDGAH